MLGSNVRNHALVAGVAPFDGSRVARRRPPARGAFVEKMAKWPTLRVRRTARLARNLGALVTRVRPRAGRRRGGRSSRDRPSWRRGNRRGAGMRLRGRRSRRVSPRWRRDCRGVATQEFQARESPCRDGPMPTCRSGRLCSASTAPISAYAAADVDLMAQRAARRRSSRRRPLPVSRSAVSARAHLHMRRLGASA